MAKGINRLSATRIGTISNPGLHADGGGLYLNVKRAGGRAWSFIYQWQGKRREMGLGSLTVVGLSDARDKRDAARDLLAAGHDPLNPPSADVLAAGRVVTFGQAADALLKALEPSFENPKHRQQWRNTLTDYCKAIWDKPVADVDTSDVVNVLTPIWHEIPETAKRLRGRMERVLDGSKVKGERSGENPARWKGHLEAILPKNKKKHGGEAPRGDALR